MDMTKGSTDDRPKCWPRWSRRARLECHGWPDANQGSADQIFVIGPWLPILDEITVDTCQL